LYALLFALFLYLLNKKIQAGPYDESTTDNRPTQEAIAEVIETTDNSQKNS